MSDQQVESLKDKITHLEGEARMIIPGIKALFGFQLVAVFNNRFQDDLSSPEQIAHWVALLCSAVAVVLALTPAAYHRQAEPHTISERLARLTNRWLTLSLIPLTMGYVIDFYLIGVLILKNQLITILSTIFLFLGFVGFWFIYPRWCRHKLRDSK